MLSGFSLSNYFCCFLDLSVRLGLYKQLLRSLQFIEIFLGNVAREWLGVFGKAFILIHQELWLKIVNAFEGLSFEFILNSFCGVRIIFCHATSHFCLHLELVFIIRPSKLFLYRLNLNEKDTVFVQ